MDKIIMPTWLAPKTPDLYLMPSFQMSQSSLAGTTQIGDNRGRLWSYKLSWNTLPSDNAVLTMRALLNSLDGMANALLVPVWDPAYGVSDAAIGAVDDLMWDGDIPWDGDIGWDGSDIGDVYVTASQYDTIITVDLSGFDSPIQAGQRIGLYKGVDFHPCEMDVYAINAVNEDDPAATVLTLNPPLRRDYADAPLSVRPRLTCQLTAVDGARMPEDLGRFAQPSLDLIEVNDWAD